MEKQLYNISNEALQDLDQIFDTVMVRKVVGNADEHHKALKQQLIEVKKDLNVQLGHLEKIDHIDELIGNIPKSVIDELDNPEDFQDKTGKYSITSILTGTGLTSVENNQKIKLLEKNIGTYPLKDRDGNIVSKSLTELLQSQYDHEISSLGNIIDLIRNHSDTAQKFHSEYLNSIEDQIEISKRKHLGICKLIEDTHLESMDSLDQLKKELVQVKNSFEQEARGNQENWQSVESMIAKNSKVSMVLSIIMTVGIGISIVLQLI